MIRAYKTGGTLKVYPHLCNGSPEGEERDKGAERMFEEIMAKSTSQI